MKSFPPAPEGILVGHSNMDLDCLGSIALARYLHPDCVPLRSARIHPLARNLFRYFQDHLGLESPKDCDLSRVSKMVIVDTGGLGQVKEYLDCLDEKPRTFVFYDHHGKEDAELPGAEYNHAQVGANTSLLCRMVMQRDVELKPEDATIALAGIFADTGNFVHANVSPLDFASAMWLLDRGADLTLVRKFTTAMYDQDFNETLHELLNNLTRLDVNGQKILLAHLELDKQSPGLALMVEKVFEFEPADAIFCVFGLKKEKNHLVVARSAQASLDVAHILSHFGGGGHPQAASALLKKSEDVPVLDHLKRLLCLHLRPALRARDIMVNPVHCLREDLSLLEASIFLEENNITGAPVLDAGNRLVGMLSLRDIQKGRKSGLMKAPVKAYMSKNVLAAGPDTSLRDIENLFYQNDLTRIPVVEAEKILGLIGRHELLRYFRDSSAPAGPNPGPGMD